MHPVVSFEQRVEVDGRDDVARVVDPYAPFDAAWRPSAVAAPDGVAVPSVGDVVRVEAHVAPHRVDVSLLLGLEDDVLQFHWFHLHGSAP